MLKSWDRISHTKKTSKLSWALSLGHKPPSSVTVNSSFVDPLHYVDAPQRWGSWGPMSSNTVYCSLSYTECVTSTPCPTQALDYYVSCPKRREFDRFFTGWEVWGVCTRHIAVPFFRAESDTTNLKMWKYLGIIRWICYSIKLIDTQVTKNTFRLSPWELPWK